MCAPIDAALPSRHCQKPQATRESMMAPFHPLYRPKEIFETIAAIPGKPNQDFVCTVDTDQSDTCDCSRQIRFLEDIDQNPTLCS